MSGIWSGRRSHAAATMRGSAVAEAAWSRANWMLPGKTAMSSAALAGPAHGCRVTRPAAQVNSARPLTATIRSDAGRPRGTRAMKMSGRTRCRMPLPVKTAATPSGAHRRAFVITRHPRSAAPSFPFASSSSPSIMRFRSVAGVGVTGGWPWRAPRESCRVASGRMVSWTPDADDATGRRTSSSPRSGCCRADPNIVEAAELDTPTLNGRRRTRRPVKAAGRCAVAPRCWRWQRRWVASRMRAG